MVSPLFSRVAGRALLWENPVHSTQSSALRQGWFTQNTNNTTPEIGIQTANNATDIFLRQQGTTLDQVPVGVSQGASANEHCFAMVMRATGGFYLTRNGMTGPYALKWVSNTGTAGLYAKMIWSANNAMTVQSDNWRITDLGGNWSTDYGIALSRTLNPATGTAFTSAADYIIDITFTWDGTQWDLWTSRVDANNGWLWRIATDGTPYLYLVQSGVLAQQKVGTAGSYSAGTSYRLMITKDGTTNFKSYQNNLKQLEQFSASPFQAATGMYLNGTGVSDLTIYPRWIDLQGA
jgi:hypothetical protein